MAFFEKKYHRSAPSVSRGTSWGQGGKEDIKFYKSRYWRGIRSVFLQKYPWCKECKNNGRFVSATHVDHIKRRHEGGSDDESNLQGLCVRCHNQKTAKESHANRNSTK